MKSVFISALTLLLLSVVLVGCSEKATGSKEEKAVVPAYSADTDNPLILKSLEDYKELALQGSGDKVAALLRKPTLDYYQGLRQAIFDENKEQVQSRSFVDQVIIIRTRILADMETLAKLDSAQFTSYVYRSGYVAKSSISHHGMGEITYDEATKEAKAPAVINGELQNAYYTFKKEDNIWKVDISQVIPLVNEAMENDIRDNGGSPERMLYLTLLSANSDQEISEKLWGPQR